MRHHSKQLYSIKQSYKALYMGLRTFKYLRKAKRKKEIDELFIKRIMLVVTQVNNCQMCSYAHTKAALKMNFSNQEIKKMLDGSYDDVPLNQIAAILFAQYYATSKGDIEEKTWLQCIDIYGKIQSEGILGAIRMITIGNIYGIVFGSFLKRFVFKSDKRSTIFYELKMIFCGIIFLPIAMIHSVISNLLSKPLV